MDRFGTVKRNLVTYPCPSCCDRHMHSYSPCEPEPLRRVTHCPREERDVLIHIKKKYSNTIDGTYPVCIDPSPT
jgi:hypothetical protein